MACHCNPVPPNLKEITPAMESNRFIVEGCCPNRCGPMARTGEHTATCACCGLKWKSSRIPSIWPSGTEKGK